MTEWFFHVTYFAKVSLLLFFSLSKFLSSGGVFFFFFHIFAKAHHLPGFSIDRLASMEHFFNVNIFFKCKYKCEYKRFIHLNNMSSMFL